MLQNRTRLLVRCVILQLIRQDFPMVSLRQKRRAMRQAITVAVFGVVLMAGAFARDLPDDVVREPHTVVGADDALADRYTQASAVNEILVTADNQILVELAPEDSVSPNPFDLNERTVVFTPDGTGQYSREVKALEWEEEIGEEVEYSAVIMLESFDFPFAGHRWDSFFLGPPGVLTFGGQFTYSIPTVDITMKEIADKFISVPTISTLYNPRQIGVQARRIARRTDRIVVTEFSIEPFFMVHGVQPEKFARFQTVLGADGSIKFNYTDVPYGDGIVGLFQDVDLTERLPDGVDLSQSDNQLSNRHHEVFRYRDLTVHTYEIACRLIDFLGEEFDLLSSTESFVWILIGGPRRGRDGTLAHKDREGYLINMYHAVKAASKVIGAYPYG